MQNILLSPDEIPAVPSGHCGMIALVGSANAGKSTLINQILGEKVSIVSPVAQTTRNMIRGILTESRGQLVFLDTPGLHQAHDELGKLMNKTARQAVEGVDLIMLVVDTARPPRLEDKGWIRRLLFCDQPVFVVLNKMDKGSSHAEQYRTCWQNAGAEKGSEKIAYWHQVSALTGEGIPELSDILFEHIPAGPLLFPPDILTDFPRKWNFADIIREQLFHVLRQELPYAVAVGIDHITETDNASWAVEGKIYVNRHSQKGIVIGHKGRQLRKITRRSESELAKMYEHPVHLKLWVKVEKNWAKNYFLMRQLGYRE
jgi:GTP-binding protein Era